MWKLIIQVTCNVYLILVDAASVCCNTHALYLNAEHILYCYNSSSTMFHQRWFWKLYVLPKRSVGWITAAFPSRPWCSTIFFMMFHHILQSLQPYAPIWYMDDVRLCPRTLFLIQFEKKKTIIQILANVMCPCSFQVYKTLRIITSK